ncbi:MAG: hypothetical protein JWM25_1482 [Thermoleophilia bacterium]|nr:hypothetical protein [Thermoleophilia bacterium]
MNRAWIITVVFAASCIVGAALDQIHVRSGALAYDHPWLLGQAWWVPLQFGFAFAGLCAFALEVQRRFGSRTPPMTATSRVVQQATWFLAAYAITGLLHQRPWTVAAILGVMLAIRIVSVRPDAPTVRIIFFLAAAGTLYEAAVSSLPETFDYAVTGAGMPVPVWLPLLYAHGAPLLRTFMKNVTAQLTVASAR